MPISFLPPFEIPARVESVRENVVSLILIVIPRRPEQL